MAAKEAFQLLKFDNFCRAFQRVIKYLETHKELMDAHMVDFFTSAHWETLLPRQIREDLELLQHEDLTALPTACNHESEIFDKFGENLKQFLTEATQAQLKSFSWVRDGRDFSSECKVNFIPHKIMTPKKSYEVEVMSDIINRLSTQFQVRKILDLGSGKGYLSQYLALQYGLKVIGVDSSHSNTESAIKRNGKLLKSWEGLLKKSRNEKVKHLGGSISGGNDSSTRQTVGDSSLKGACFTCISLSNNGCDFNNKETCALGQDDKKSLVSDPHEAGRMLSPLSKYSIHVNPEKPLHKKDFPVPASQSFNMNPSNGHFPSSAEECNQVGWNNSSVIATSHYDEPSAKSQTSFLPVTGFVDQSFVANGELRKLFDQLTSSGEDNYCPNGNGTFLIGLHTCGDLVPMALRIFVSEPSVKLICIVGCCYHLVSQRFGKESACSSDEPGFPMSKFLKSFRLQISRNATMVAQQAAERISSESKVPPPSVLYRAILQVILKEKFGLDGRGLAVGKAGSKCKSFKEYVHKCLIKLGLQDHVNELSDEELESFHGRFKSKEKQLHAFYQLRAAIAPCIESVFILDRLCYLYEEGFKSACIMRVFDPVKSPRCYAIIASKM